jgi:hypothetical protein
MLHLWESQQCHSHWLYQPYLSQLCRASPWLFDAPTRVLHSLVGLWHWWLTLQTIGITEGLKVKFKLTSVVVDNVLTTGVMTKPGPIYYVTYCCWRLVKVGLFWLYMYVLAPLPLCTCGDIKFI